MSSLELDTQAAFSRTLAALDSHVAALERDVSDVYAEYGLAPSDNQWFMYTSSSGGNIQCHQDAAFVCEAIMVIGYVLAGDRSNPPVTNTLTLSVQQMGPRHRMTFSRNKAPSVADTGLLDNGGVSPEAFVPVSLANLNITSYNNADYFYRLPVEWLIPRGEAVQTMFAGQEVFRTSTATLFNAIPRVVLLGYKVF